MPIVTIRSRSELMRALRTSTTVSLAYDFAAYHGSSSSRLVLPRGVNSEVLDLTDMLAIAVRHATSSQQNNADPSSEPIVYRLALRKNTRLATDSSEADPWLEDGTVTLSKHGIGIHFRIWNAKVLEVKSKRRIAGESSQTLHDLLG